jgi:hypothetical protein
LSAIVVERKIRASAGLVRYDAKNEALDWPQAAKDALSNEKPNAIVVMLGLNDRLPLREKAPAEPKQNGDPAKGANQSASQPSQDRSGVPADTASVSFDPMERSLTNPNPEVPPRKPELRRAMCVMTFRESLVCHSGGAQECNIIATMPRSNANPSAASKST